MPVAVAPLPWPLPLPFPPPSPLLPPLLVPSAWSVLVVLVVDVVDVVDCRRRRCDRCRATVVRGRHSAELVDALARCLARLEEVAPRWRVGVLRLPARDRVDGRPCRARLPPARSRQDRLRAPGRPRQTSTHRRPRWWWPPVVDVARMPTPSSSPRWSSPRRRSTAVVVSVDVDVVSSPCSFSPFVVALLVAFRRGLLVLVVRRTGQVQADV